MTQRYSSYKDSGIQWLGEIPSHWDIPTFKRVCKLKSGNTNVEETSDGEIPFVRVSDMNLPENNLFIETSKSYVNKTDCINSLFPIGSVIFPKRGGAIKTNKRRIVRKEICCDLNIMGAIPGERVFPIFLYYYLLSKDFGTLYNGSAVPQINNGDIDPLPFPLPPLSEQHAIVSYLDDKCSKIDRWTAGKQKEVELLKQLKARTIADAVTRGLNPNAKMKPTGIQWLPEVPEHWEISKINSHFRQRNEKVSDIDYPALSVSKQGVTPQLDNVALSSTDGTARKLVKIGDYAVNSRSDRKGSCGISSYEGSVSLITIVLEPFDICGDYVHYLFRSNPWIEEFYRNGRGIVADLWTTNYQIMKNMYIPVPPLSKQKEIVSYIQQKTSKIDKLIQGINSEIEAVKQYRNRLISDVVTGQLKVC